METGATVMIQEETIMRRIGLMGFVLSFTLVACSSPVTPSGATDTPARIAVTASPTQLTMQSATPVLELTSTPTVQPTMQSVTPALEPTGTPTASPTPVIPPTSTPTPTPSVDPRIAQLCGIGRVSPPQVNHQVLYFRPSWGDWYRTADKFATTEWVAPYGALSPDLKTLIVFECDDPGSICVATPPQATPVPLPLHYEPPDSASHFVHWLPGNQRLIFWAGNIPLPSEGEETVTQLYLLDLQAPSLHQITDELFLYEAVSPLGTCVAYTEYDALSEQGYFHLINVENADNLIDWSVPVKKPYRYDKWPNWGEEMAWSPDGSSLAFTIAPRSIVVWNLATDEREEYKPEHGGGFPSVFKWSPEGDRIYFVATGSEGGLFHWVLDLTTGEFRTLAKASGLQGTDAYQWLPNGIEIVVSGVFGSLLLDTSDGSTQELIYPGIEENAKIFDMFLGPTSP